MVVSFLDMADALQIVYFLVLLVLELLVLSGN
jgi:hypothetical protein